jgi:hypothetical protein
MPGVEITSGIRRLVASRDAVFVGALPIIRSAGATAR